MVIDISKQEILEYKKMEVITELTVIREKIRLLEQKYGSNIKKFEQEMKSQEEDFEKWDDFIDWTAYTKIEESLVKKLDELENAKDINITTD